MCLDVPAKQVSFFHTRGRDLGFHFDFWKKNRKTKQIKGMKKNMDVGKVYHATNT